MNLWRKIKYQTSCCIRGLLSFPPNIPGKRVTLLVGKKSKNCNCNGRKSPLRVKQTRNKAEQNGPIIEPLWNLKNVPSVPVFCLACYNSLYVAKRTNQVAAFERCWSTALLRGYHLSPSSVWIYVIHIHIFICWPGGPVREKRWARRGIGRVHAILWTEDTVFLLRVFPNRICENDRELRMVAHWFAEEMTRARISTVWDKWPQAWRF